MKYADVLKAVNDFFDKTFIDGHTIEHKAKTSAGVTFTGEGKVSGGKFSSKIKASGVKVNRFAIDKVEIASKGTIKADGKFAGIVKGLDLTFAFEDGTAASGTDISAKVGGEFATDAADVTIDVDVAKGPSAKATALFAKSNAVVGVSAAVNTAEISKGLGAFSAYDFLLGYKTGGFTGGVEVTNKLSTVSVGAIQKNDNGSFAVKTGLALAGAGKGDKAAKFLGGVDIQAGGSFVYDPSLTVHAAINQAGTLRLATENKISNTATLTLGGAIDLTAIGRDVHSVSTKLSISA
eukprot:CAMPEP_0116827004 /NCGR_PEP_ID=MMETSP0418-20121206/2852_1 /TAXON_ID=1158023 /ORGANISM="Astrosyne radiata, Strain 13vi08-1A" /LENGTH=292 /DNA_ID=CAMNT_0004455719 /DNA_START=17 /DNA_END=895 /DNA_ORIENTATION=+